MTRRKIIYIWQCLQVCLLFHPQEGAKFKSNVLLAAIAPSGEEFWQLFLSSSKPISRNFHWSRGFPVLRVRRINCTKKNISLEMECIDSTSKMIGTALPMHGWWLRIDWWVSSRTFFPNDLYGQKSSYIFEVIEIVFHQCWPGKNISPQAGPNFKIYNY